MYLLTYSLPLQRLYITGKNANPAYTLDSTKIANAVAAGSFRLDRASKTIAELFTALGEYDPVVRNYAAIELAVSLPLRHRSHQPPQSAHQSRSQPPRQSACQALGIRQDSTALPTIVDRLNDPDIWVRAKAGDRHPQLPIRHRQHPSRRDDDFLHRQCHRSRMSSTGTTRSKWATASSRWPSSAMPCAMALPETTSPPTPSTPPKQTLLYPALRAGLRQPDSYVRLGAAQILQGLAFRWRIPRHSTRSVATVAEYDTPADRMWSNDCRAEAITLLANLKISDGIELALAMLEVPDDFGWGSGTY